MFSNLDSVLAFPSKNSTTTLYEELSGETKKVMGRRLCRFGCVVSKKHRLFSQKRGALKVQRFSSISDWKRIA
jgi:hypothetical protein